jgi:coproporphyrinogen III oxidase-like Fe-S oxidoreductase
MVSPAGGIDIEDVAEKTPEKILKLAVDTRFGLTNYQASRLAWFVYDDPKLVKQAAKIMQGLYKAFMKHGCSTAEISSWSRPRAKCSRSTRKWSSMTTSSIVCPISRSYATKAPRRQARCSPAMHR